MTNAQTRSPTISCPRPSAGSPIDARCSRALVGGAPCRYAEVVARLGIDAFRTRSPSRARAHRSDDGTEDAASPGPGAPIVRLAASQSVSYRRAGTLHARGVMGILLRRLSRIDAFAVALGGVIGVGVFRATGLALRGTSGFAGATLLWLGIGVVCLAGAIVFADLSGRVPEAGGPMPTCGSRSAVQWASSTAGSTPGSRSPFVRPRSWR
jgi:hypothetical protein